MKSCLEEALRQELSEHLGFGRYERQRHRAKGSRSGYFKRRVTTDHGEIPDPGVPKLGSGNKERDWKILSRYQRCLGYLFYNHQVRGVGWNDPYPRRVFPFVGKPVGPGQI